jgi:hypothetical protein
MAKSKEELLSNARAVRAALKQDMSPQQRLDHEAAVQRKAAVKEAKLAGTYVAAKVVAGSDEFEESLNRSLSRLLEACEGVERHHKRSWLESRVLQDFAAAFDTVRGVTGVDGGGKRDA